MKHLPRQEERTKRKFDTISAIANAITFGLLIYTLDGFAHHEKMDFLFIQLIVLVVVGNLLRAPSTQPNHSITTLGPITYPYFPTVYPDLHLFVYRANVGNGFFTLFPAKHLGTQ